MEYVHIPTGVRVTSEAELPAVLYKKAVQAEKPKTATRKRTTKKEQ